MEAAAFTSASQLGIAGKFSSSSSSSACSRSLRFLQNKHNSIDLNSKPSRSSIRASATGEEDSDPRLCYWRGGFRGNFARLWRWKCPESRECNSVSRL
nr:imidazole glycerol phosphate synthase hisHF, chloroplastic-like [Ipomoea batatas]GME15413.1 imidazole glycerol phosphate synthase hisHF, chloroplastic-like [Ipomoea batatas]